MNEYTVTIEVPGSNIPVEVKDFSTEIEVLDYCRELCLRLKRDVKFSANGLNSVVLNYVS